MNRYFGTVSSDVGSGGSQLSADEVSRVKLLNSKPMTESSVGFMSVMNQNVASGSNVNFGSVNAGSLSVNNQVVTCGTFYLQMKGPWSGNQPFAFDYSRVGSIVFLVCNSSWIGTGSSTLAMSSVSGFPAALKPAYTKIIDDVPLFINGTKVSGQVGIGCGGIDLSFGSPTYGSTNTAGTGVYGFANAMFWYTMS